MNSRSQRILWIALAFSISFFLLAVVLFRRLCRYRQPVRPCNAPQVAYITQPYQQQPRFYQPVWPPPSFEPPPPSYYTAMNGPPVKI